MKPTGCPSRDVLQAYHTGELSEPTAQDVTTHVSECSTCQATLKTLDQAGDAFLARLRASAAEEPFVDESECQRMLAQVGALAPSPASVSAPPSFEAAEAVAFGQIGEYELLEKLGEGGIGTVYKARQVHLDRVVALKVLRHGHADSQQAVARFYREMKAVGRVDHPHIVRAMDAREIEGKPVLVMEYVSGRDLHALVRKLRRLPMADACELVRQAAVGLQ